MIGPSTPGEPAQRAEPDGERGRRASVCSRYRKRSDRVLSSRPQTVGELRPGRYAPVLTSSSGGF